MSRRPDASPETADRSLSIVLVRHPSVPSDSDLDNPLVPLGRPYPGMCGRLARGFTIRERVSCEGMTS